jgi:hypothetical protein
MTRNHRSGPATDQSGTNRSGSAYNLLETSAWCMTDIWCMRREGGGLLTEIHKVKTVERREARANTLLLPHL